MSERFRLGRLLRVRAEEERSAKLAWAVEVAGARAAADVQARAEGALESARREAARTRAGEVPGRSLGAAPLEETVFAAMGDEIARTAARAEAAAEAADGARARYDEARGRVLALERLQQRWSKEQRRTRRRREARALDETLATITARKDAATAQDSPAGGAERR